MNQITVLSDEAYQQVNLALDDGTTALVELIYRPAIQRWTFNISHPRLTLNNAILCVSPNLLRPWRNRISFGLACLSQDGLDPILSTDFSNARCTLYALSAEEVESVESSVIGVPA